jgi:hypothetical protein
MQVFVQETYARTNGAKFKCRHNASAQAGNAREEG